MAVSLDLPVAVRAELDRRLEGVARGDLAGRAAQLSAGYRSGQSSYGVVSRDADALAYAVVRMPATYAAVRRVLEEAKRLLPEAPPTRVLDVGAGPGTATLALVDAWPALRHATLVEPNAALAQLSRALIEAVGLSHTLQAHAVADVGAAWQSVDLAIMSYVLVELSDAAARAAVAKLMTSDAQTIVLVEPGTTAGFARILAARDVLIAGGWAIAAPCPHAQACPLPKSDWCHFRVRLARRRDHRIVKGADAPYEDEPYSYLVASRVPLAASGVRRVLRSPHIDKAGVRLSLCTANGLATAQISRRSVLYKAARKLSAGDDASSNFEV